MKTATFKILAIIIITTVIGCNDTSKTKGSKKTIYSCTMHHQVRENKAGTCPICGMELVVVPDINNW